VKGPTAYRSEINIAIRNQKLDFYFVQGEGDKPMREKKSREKKIGGSIFRKTEPPG